MSEYKKKSIEDAYTPRKNRQTVRIEACLSHTAWKSAEGIYSEVNGPGQEPIALSRIRDHLRYHCKRGRLIWRDV